MHQRLVLKHGLVNSAKFSVDAKLNCSFTSTDVLEFVLEADEGLPIKKDWNFPQNYIKGVNLFLSSEEQLLSLQNPATNHAYQMVRLSDLFTDIAISLPHLSALDIAPPVLNFYHPLLSLKLQCSSLSHLRVCLCEANLRLCSEYNLESLQVECKRLEIEGKGKVASLDLHVGHLCHSEVLTSLTELSINLPKYK